MIMMTLMARMVNQFYAYTMHQSQVEDHGRSNNDGVDDYNLTSNRAELQILTFTMFLNRTALQGRNYHQQLLGKGQFDSFSTLAKQQSTCNQKVIQAATS